MNMKIMPSDGDDDDDACCVNVYTVLFIYIKIGRLVGPAVAVYYLRENYIFKEEEKRKMCIHDIMCVSASLMYVRNLLGARLDLACQNCFERVDI